jgi:succinyl-diaminopimelate desuccinylase
MKNLAEEILELVRVPSVTGTERVLADLLERRFREGPVGRTHAVRRHGESLIVWPEVEDAPGAARPLVLLAGHLDTVPIGEAGEPRLEGGRVIGRGACDMKAGVAVMLHLVEQMPVDAGFARRGYVFYAGEEGPASGNQLGAVMQADARLREAALGILLEPTSGQLELGCNGSMHANVTFRGKAAHSARPWQGRHPLRPALDWLGRTLDRPIREAAIAGVVFRELVSLTRLRAGETRNVIPAALEQNVNLRYPPDRTPEEAERLMVEIVPSGAARRGFRAVANADEAEWRDAEVTAELCDHAPPGRIDLEAPIYRHLLESTGLPRRAKQGWTDVSRLTALGIPALNWGPGDPELAHTREEFVEVAEAEVCLDAMRRFLAGDGPAR